MRCLVFGLHDRVGGVERYTEILASELLSKKIYFDYVSPYKHMALEEKFLSLKSKIYHVSSFKRNPLKYIIEINEIIKNGHYDVVYVNMLSAANVLPFIVSRRNNVKKIIAHSHNNATPKGVLRKILHLLNYRIIEKIGTNFWACSTLAAKWLFPDLKEDAVKIIPDAIDMNKFRFSESRRLSTRKELDITDNEFVFGHIGRFEEQKNHLFLLKVFNEIHKKHLNSKLILVGDGELRQQVETYVDKEKLNDCVLLVGSVEDTAKYYDAMDAFLFPSKFEGFGIAVIEAETSGLSCCISDNLSKSLEITDVRYVKVNNLEQWVTECEKMIKEKTRSYTRRKRFELCNESRYSLKFFSHDIWKSFCEL